MIDGVRCASPILRGLIGIERPAQAAREATGVSESARANVGTQTD